MSLPIQITKIVLRRVQNGFVVDCINENLQEQYRSHTLDYKGPQRACFIAGDIPELTKLLQSFVDMGDVGWAASLPMPVMTRRMAGKIDDGDTSEDEYG